MPQTTNILFGCCMTETSYEMCELILSYSHGVRVIDEQMVSCHSKE